jgi:hypothetical protein
MNNPADGKWITHKPPKNSKRILSSSSSGDSHPQTPSPLYKKLFTTRNRFEALNQNQNDTPDIYIGTTSDTEVTNDAIYIKPPPPIFMKGILDIPNFSSALIELIGVDHFFCKSASDCLKI